MKLIIQIMIILIPMTSFACSEQKKQPEAAKTATPADIIKTEAISINNAKKTLEDAKQVDQVIMDSADRQRESIEKTQQ